MMHPINGRRNAIRNPHHAVLSFAGSVETIRPLVSEIPPAVVAERLGLIDRLREAAPAEAAKERKGVKRAPKVADLVAAQFRRRRCR